MIVLPATSMRVAPAGTFNDALGPMRSIRPLLTRTVAFAIGAAPVPSITRAPTSAIVVGV